MRSTAAVVAILLLGPVVSACGWESPASVDGSTDETWVAPSPGDCVTGALGNGQLVACDDPDARYEIIREVTIRDYDLNDPGASPCGTDEIELEQTSVVLDGPLTGARATEATWCAVEVTASG